MPSTEHKNITARLPRYFLDLKRSIAESERLLAEDGEDFSTSRRKLEAMARPGADFKYPPRPGQGAFQIRGRAIIAVMEASANGLDVLYEFSTTKRLISIAMLLGIWLASRYV